MEALIIRLRGPSHHGHCYRLYYSGAPHWEFDDKDRGPRQQSLVFWEPSDSASLSPVDIQNSA